MEIEKLKEKITGIEPGVVFEESGGFLHAIVEPSKGFSLIERLNKDPELKFDWLTCLTCVDWNQFFYVTYFLRSLELKHELVVKVKITDRANPITESVTKIWAGAELLEREVYDLFGIKFHGHPDLRRILLDEQCNGLP